MGLTPSIFRDDIIERIPASRAKPADHPEPYPVEGDGDPYILCGGRGTPLP
jgi:hypothetical protein